MTIRKFSARIWIAPLCFLLFFPALSRGAQIRIQAKVDPPSCAVGDPINYTVIVETDDTSVKPNPNQPDFGGLRLVSGPQTGQQMSIINTVVRATYSETYTLSASSPGDYIIGPAEVEVDGATYQAESVKVHVEADSLSAFPPSLQSQPILNPRSHDASINQQLRGKICLRPELSEASPYVGEPFVVAFQLYVDPAITRSVQDYKMILPPSLPMLAEEVPDNAGKSFRSQSVDGRTYNLVTFYQTILTPTQPGDFALDGYGVRLLLSVRGGGAFFNNTIAVDAMTAPIRVKVRPLPAEGRDPKFSGTVGSFIMDSQVDRASANQDDIITLTVTLMGEGNIAQAALPVWPENPDFEMFDQTQKVEKTATAQGLHGKKTIEYLLKPARNGRLTIPKIETIVFDPKREGYVTLESASREIQIAPGQPKQALAGVPADSKSAGGGQFQGLRYIKPVIDFSRIEPAPVLENALYWMAQIGAMAWAGFAVVRARRRDALDPVLERKRGARGGLDKKLAHVRKLAGSGEAEASLDAALSLERAIREYVADMNNLSADGLTGEQIAQRLMLGGMAQDRARRIAEIVGLCATARYLPGAVAGLNMGELIQESSSILAEKA